MECSLRVVVILAACSLIFGCDSGKRGEPAKFPVKGTVTIDGKPLPQGLVYLKTVATGAIDTFDVKEGKFEGKAQQGERRVEVCVYEKVPPKPNDPMSRETQKNTIPARYNRDSKLTVTVSPSGPNEFEFQVASR
jgi:hypothetical protein